MNPKIIHPQTIIKARVAIVVSDFNQDVTHLLLEGACQVLKAHELTIIHVPGAIEIPLALQCLAQQHCYDALIAIGAVIRGETSHYDYVCDQVSMGCQQVMLQFNLPVIFGVLTTENTEQALARAGGAEGNKGTEAALAALAMVSVLSQIKAPAQSNAHS